MTHHCPATVVMPDGEHPCQTHPLFRPDDLLTPTTRRKRPVVHRVHLETVELGLGQTIIDWCDGSRYAGHPGAR